MSTRALSEYTEQNAQVCIHFRGIQHGTCLAGVHMRAVRDGSGSGPARWPCLPPMRGAEPCRTTCAHKRLPTPEELRVDEEQVRRALLRAFGLEPKP